MATWIFFPCKTFRRAWHRHLEPQAKLTLNLEGHGFGWPTPGTTSTRRRDASGRDRFNAGNNYGVNSGYDAFSRRRMDFIASYAVTDLPN
jgi:hypothetical protein